MVNIQIDALYQYNTELKNKYSKNLLNQHESVSDSDGIKVLYQFWIMSNKSLYHKYCCDKWSLEK